MRRSIAMVALAALATGCGPSVKGLCDELSDECVEYVPEDDCRDAGGRLEDQAEARGCEEVFDAYLDCIDVALCDWRDRCGEDRAAVDACIGGDRR